MGKEELELKDGFWVHPRAIVSPRAHIGERTCVWAFAQIREEASIGNDCVIGQGAYIDSGVILGSHCNVHNYALLYRRLLLEDEVFIGPGACITNDPRPRAQRFRDLTKTRGHIKKGASIGARAVILPDLVIGYHALVGAGAVVTKDVPDFGLVYGVPAKLIGFVSPEGEKLICSRVASDDVEMRTPDGTFSITLPRDVYESATRERTPS